MRLEVTIEPEDTCILADRTRMKQLLLNLLSNSIKFTRPGGLVSLDVRRDPDGGTVFSVKDTGIGIAADQLDLVLEPFGQVQNVFSRHHRGTGLGLPMTRSIAQLHGGDLEISSQPDVGTTVVVTLPPERTLNPEDADD